MITGFDGLAEWSKARGSGPRLLLWAQVRTLRSSKLYFFLGRLHGRAPSFWIPWVYRGGEQEQKWLWGEVEVSMPGRIAGESWRAVVFLFCSLRHKFTSSIPPFGRRGHGASHLGRLGRRGRHPGTDAVHCHGGLALLLPPTPHRPPHIIASCWTIKCTKRHRNERARYTAPCRDVGGEDEGGDPEVGVEHRARIVWAWEVCHCHWFCCQC